MITGGSYVKEASPGKNPKRRYPCKKRCPVFLGIENPFYSEKERTGFCLVEQKLENKVRREVREWVG